MGTWSGKFNTAHTCDYVAEDPTNRCRFESSDGISANSACPEACDDECSPPPGVGDDDAMDDTVDDAIGDDAIGDDDFDDIIDNDDSLSCIDDSTWSGKFNTAHNCDYVAEDPTNRCRF